MSGPLATLSLALTVGAVFALATSLAVAALWPWASRRLASVHPGVRALVAWLAAVAPAAIPVLLLALCFLPGVLGAVGLASDHCVHHPDHAHLCLFHATAALTPARAGLLALAALLAVVAVAPDLRRMFVERRWLAGLPRRTAASCTEAKEAKVLRYEGEALEIVECSTPFSFAAGLWRPRVHVAAGLVAALPERQLAAVIAHERAHAHRRDSLRRLTARVLSRVHLPAVRRALLAELALATEQACDAEAGRQIGDRVTVAETILAVERLLAGAPDRLPPGLAAFGGSFVADRVKGLLADETPRPPRAVCLLAGVFALLIALAVADGLHHETEHLLALATRWL